MNRINNQQGKALPIVLAFSIIAQLLGGFMLSQVAANRQLLDYEEAHMYSDYITDAGLQWMRNAVYEDSDIVNIVGAHHYSLDEIIYIAEESLLYTGNYSIEVVQLDEELVEITVRSTMNMPAIDFPINNVLTAIVNKDTALYP